MNYPRLRVLVACECSGRVRDAFRDLGHDAWSCDLQPSEYGSNSKYHFQCDVTEILDSNWDLMIGHPPCTYLCRLTWFNRGPMGSHTEKDSREGLAFVKLLMNTKIPHIAIENPPGMIGSRIRPADQTIQPWMFGHDETKATNLWLKNLPCLKPTDIVDGREHRIWEGIKGTVTQVSRERSRTYIGIARAMAKQWSAPFIVAPKKWAAYYDSVYLDSTESNS